MDRFLLSIDPGAGAHRRTRISRTQIRAMHGRPADLSFYLQRRRKGGPHAERIHLFQLPPGGCFGIFSHLSAGFAV
jgi:hypothetical protein